MIILDDNYASIESAVKEGRKIFANIQKFIGYLLSANVAEVLVVFIGMIVAFKDSLGVSFVVLTPIQILWLNLITDGMPALAMSVDTIDDTVMNLPPRKISDPILSLSYSTELLIISILVTTGTLLACYLGVSGGVEHAQTMAFTTLVVLELIVAQIVRYRFRSSLFSNLWFLGSIVVSFIMHLCIIYFPVFHSIFKITRLTFSDWRIIATITAGFTLANYLFFKGLNFLKNK